jgi:hypothetical protein
MSNGFERIWKEVLERILRRYPSLCLQGLVYTTKNLRISGLRTETGILYFLNTKQECFEYDVPKGSVYPVKFVQYYSLMMKEFFLIRL